MNLTLGRRIRVVPVNREELQETYQVSEIRPDKSVRLTSESRPEVYLDIYPIVKEKGY